MDNLAEVQDKLCTCAVNDELEFPPASFLFQGKRLTSEEREVRVVGEFLHSVNAYKLRCH